jgi:TatD DNase family protein
MSFAGNVTYPNAEELRGAAAAVGADQLLVETDSPFLAPQATRGRSNAPANLILTLQQIATVRGLNLDQMVEVTSRAASRAFPLIR